MPDVPLSVMTDLGNAILAGDMWFAAFKRLFHNFMQEMGFPQVTIPLVVLLPSVFMNQTSNMLGCVNSFLHKSPACNRQDL